MLNNRKKTIGVFVCKLPEYFQRTLCGALADEAVANGYNLVVFSTFGEYDNNHDYVEGESNCLYIPNYDELDGIILCLDVFDIPGMAGKLIEQVKEKAHCPVISIRQKRDEFISVLSDDKKAIMAMVDHLIDEHNAKRIYYLSGPSYMHDIRMREDGFRESYITSYRMEKAQELLIHTQKKIKEIAFLVGYKDELYFSKVFARLYGMSPSKFRKTMLT